MFILLSAAKALVELFEPDWLNCSCDKDDTLGLAYYPCYVTWNPKAKYMHTSCILCFFLCMYLISWCHVLFWSIWEVSVRTVCFHWRMNIVSKWPHLVFVFEGLKTLSGLKKQICVDTMLDQKFQKNFMNFYAAWKILSINMSKLPTALVIHVSGLHTIPIKILITLHFELYGLVCFYPKWMYFDLGKKKLVTFYLRQDLFTHVCITCMILL